MKRETGVIEDHIDTTPTLVFSLGDPTRTPDVTFATEEEIAIKRRIDLQRVSAYSSEDLRFLPKRVARFKMKHSGEIAVLNLKQKK